MSLNIELMNEVTLEYWRVKPSKGGKKMLIRTRKEIQDHQEMIKGKLEREIKQGIILEEKSDESIASLTEELKFVSSEVPYEETLAGETERLETLSFSVVNKILNKLSKQTGKEYYIEERS